MKKVSNKKKISYFMVIVMMVMIVSFMSARVVPVNATSNPNCTIDWNTTYQTIDGFGAMGGSWSYGSFLYNMNEQVRSQVLDMLYDKNSGMGLSVFRDDLTNTYQHDPNNYDYGDGEMARWMWGEAKTRGCSMFFSSVWGQPAWMKTNNNINGGSLATSHYQDYADYLVKYVKDYKSLYNIDVSAISIQNEPDNTNDGVPTTLWSSTQFHDFIGTLKTTFAGTNWGSASKPLTVIPETCFPSGADMANSTLDDSNTRTAVDILAVHGYAYPNGYLDSGNYFQKALGYGKKVWQTEVNGQGVYDESIGTAVRWGKSIYSYMTLANAGMWNYCDTMDYDNVSYGLINLNWYNNSYSVTKKLYTIGQFSKYVRPGYIRIDANESSLPSGVHVVAFKEPTSPNNFAIVAINENTSGSQSIDFNISNFTNVPGTVTQIMTTSTQNWGTSSINVSSGVFTATLPANSVTTFIRPFTSPTPTPTPTLAPTPTPLPVGVNMVTNAGFEQGNTGWDRRVWGDNSAVNDGKAHGGSYALKCWSTSTNTTFGYAERCQYLKVEPNTTYQLTAYGKFATTPAANEYGRISLDVYNASATVDSYPNYSSTVTAAADVTFNTTSYVSKSVQITTPSDAVFMEVHIEKPSQQGSGIFYADDISVVKVDAGATPTPEPTPSGSTIGYTAVGTMNDGIGPNYMNSFKFQANSSMIVDTMKLYVNTASTGHIKCAIYADSSGHPGNVLMSTGERSNVGTGWQSFSLTSSLQLTSGTNYWLAVWSDDGVYRVAYDSMTNKDSYGQVTYAANWPNSPSLASLASEEFSLYAFEAGSTPTPTPTPTPSGSTIGYTTVGTMADGIGPNYMNSFKFQASSSMTVDTMKLYVNTASTGHIKCAIYTDSSGHPGNVLMSTGERSNVGTGWQSFNLTSSLQLTSGTNYWLAVWSDDGVYRVAYDSMTNKDSYGQVTYAANWPNSPSLTWLASEVFSLYAQ